MAHAWLDSLSDDWVSQPNSDELIEQLPPLKDTYESQSPTKHHQSRIPLRSTGSKPLYSPSNPNSSNILIERSSNDINKSRSSKSKLSNEIKVSKTHERTVSTATNGSVVYTKASQESSPFKAGQTPEWKRRLIYGELGYGEQKDLFCSAATGLQDMFKPPPVPEHDNTMPSSPPGYQYGLDEDMDRLVGLAEEEDYHQSEQVTPSPSPRKSKRSMNYRSTSEAFTADQYGETPSRLEPKNPVLRQLSGQSVVRNEDFSPILVGRRDSDGGSQVDFGHVQMPTEDLLDKLEQLQISQLDEFSSPDLRIDTSEMLPEESLQASTPKEYPSVRTQSHHNDHHHHHHHHNQTAPELQSPSLPRAPFPSPAKKTSSGGSPLKLFGPYDTFTNQTLLRRISQFEDVNSAATSRHSPALSEASEEYENRSVSEEYQGQSNRSVSFFGDGDLNGFEFAAAADLENEAASPEGGVSFPGPAYPLSMRQARQPSTASQDLLVPRRRDKSGASSLRLTSAPKIINNEEHLIDKRLRSSPVKDPTPKRRRTLHKSDIAYGLQEADEEASHLLFGKKRKDLPKGFPLADPEVLALRDILQPRSPTPTRVSSQRSEDTKANDAAVSRRQPVGGSRTTPVVDRKPSIRTQDFVDQAAQIMAMIRSQVKPNGMTSVDESEEDNVAASVDNISITHHESTCEPFSRPPSRDAAKAVPKLPTEVIDNSELADRLKKYREFSNMGDLISSSMRSLGLAQEAIKAEGPLVTNGLVVSDIPNVRLTTNPDIFSSSPRPEHSSGRLSSNTVPTTSSRGSDSRRTILPDTVSHLIPDRVGSMYLDKQQNIWIKSKEPDQEEEAEPPSSPVDDSEPDPFASIPDLTVDMTKELENLKRAANSDAVDETMPRIVSAARHELAKLEATPYGYGQNTTSSTRRRNMTISFSSPIASVIQEALPEYIDSAEDEDRSYEDSLQFGRQGSETPSPTQPVPGSYLEVEKGARTASSRYGSIKGQDFVPRPVSPIDEQDEEPTVELPLEQDHYQQLSIIGGGGDQSWISRITPDRQPTSLSLILTKNQVSPSAYNALTLLGDESFVVGQNVGKLSLSPLSEFTLNQPDQSFGLEVSYLVGQRHVSTGDSSKRIMSMTIRDLVDRLSEVESFEPYWEDITDLDLHGKRLTSLHMLDEFCSKAVSLDASENALGHLEGVPSSVRQLKVSQNCLTELTSWDHLMNLQYVDISANEIKSLSALRRLVHLRSLRADDNKLTSLEGLAGHDGLLALRARDNLIRELDFDGIMLQRLTELDLTGNQIESIQGVHLLPALTKLKLSQNKLENFAVAARMDSLRHLDLSDNELTHLDVKNLPNLQTLHADRNCLSEISGLTKAKRLDSLSLKEQRCEKTLDLGFLTSAYEVRKLYLSGNLLENFDLQVDMLNLQLLDLANCGLSTLPPHIGQLMPNLRTLNVNFNAIADLSPLKYIPRLKKLLAAGNRLADSTSVSELLIGFPHLSRLDVRDNPITLGYYAPSQALVLLSGEDKNARFTLPDADELRDEQYSSRLDNATKLRRRLHQVVLAASCKRLRMLDGLEVRRGEILAVDAVMQQLIEAGLIPDLDEEEQEQEEAKDSGEAKDDQLKEEDLQVPESSRWGAEDSFA